MNNEKIISLVQSQFIIYHSSLDALKTISLNHIRNGSPEFETVKKIICKTCDEIKNGLLEELVRYNSSSMASEPHSAGIREPDYGDEPYAKRQMQDVGQKRSLSSSQGMDTNLGPHQHSDPIISNVSLYTFQFKDNSAISIDKSVLNKYPFFTLTQLAAEAGPDPKLPIHVNHPLGFFQIAYDYMLGKNIKIKRIDTKSKMHLYEDFEFYNIPIPNALKVFNPKDQIQKQWKADSFKVLIDDNVYKINRNTLKRRNLENTYFSKRRDRRVGYDIDKDALTIPMHSKYYKYIDMYIRTGKITIDDEDMKSLKEIKQEFKMFGIELDDKKWSIDAYKLEDMKDSTLITNLYGYYIHKWLGEKKQWKLIYKATVDGFGVDSFHKHCDDKGETLILYRVLYGENRCLFGSYNSVSWKASSNSQSDYIKDADAFLFTLENPDHTLPVRFICKHHNSALVYNSHFGPIFGYTDFCYSGEDESKTCGKGYILDNDKQIYTCKNNNHIYSFVCKTSDKQENGKMYSFKVEEMEAFSCQ